MQFGLILSNYLDLSVSCHTGIAAAKMKRAKHQPNSVIFLRLMTSSMASNDLFWVISNFLISKASLTWQMQITFEWPPARMHDPSAVQLNEAKNPRPSWMKNDLHQNSLQLILNLFSVINQRESKPSKKANIPRQKDMSRKGLCSNPCANVGKRFLSREISYSVFLYNHFIVEFVHLA